MRRSGLGRSGGTPKTLLDGGGGVGRPNAGQSLEENSLGRERHSGPPRTLNVWEFASARAGEIKSLHESLAEDGSDTGPFTLPRHLRRRTTSHNRRHFIFRPKKQKVETETTQHEEAGSKPQSRKVRRRAMLQALRRGDRTEGPDGVVRLDTHVWHAKRFAMERQWDHVLALGLPGRGRGSRSILRGARTAALIHDSTYVQPIQLEGPRTAIISILESVSNYSLRKRAAVEAGSVAGEVMLHKRGKYPLGLIAPATLIWRPRAVQSSGPAVKGERKAEFEVSGDDSSVRISESVRAALVETEEDVLGDYIPLEGAVPEERQVLAAGAQMKDSCKAGQHAIETKRDSTRTAEMQDEDRMEVDVGPENEQRKDSGGPFQPEGDPGEVLVWVHAAAFEEALEELQGAYKDTEVTCKLRRGEFVRMDVIGARAHAVLSRVLHPVREEGEAGVQGLGIPSDALTASKIWEKLAGQESSELAPPRCILSFLVEDPRRKEEALSEVEAPALSPGPAADARSPSHVPLHNTSENEPLKVPPKSAAVDKSSFCPPPLTPLERWRKLVEEGSDAAHLADCPLLWQPRRNAVGRPLWPKPVPEKILNEERRQSRLASFGLSPELAGCQAGPARGQTSESCPIWLIQRPAGTAAFSGWTLVVPSGWAMAFWVPLIYAGAHAVGQRESHWVATDAGLPFFPNDYPDCPVYSRLQQSKLQRDLDEYAKTPPSKRSPNPPSLPDWAKVCGRDQSADVSASGGDAAEMSTYFVARDQKALANCLGALGGKLEPSKAHRSRAISVRQGLRSGKLAWRAIDRSPREAPSEESVSWGQSKTPCVLVEALLKMPRKGVPEQDAQILMPNDEDFEAWCKVRTWQGVVLPDRKKGKQASEGTEVEERHVLGYVTSPCPPSGSPQNRAFAIVDAAAISRLRARQFSEKAGSGGEFVFVLVHNEGSNTARPGLLMLKNENN